MNMKSKAAEVTNPTFHCAESLNLLRNTGLYYSGFTKMKAQPNHQLLNSKPLRSYSTRTLPRNTPPFILSKDTEVFTQ
jgi:hypothetical protein